MANERLQKPVLVLNASYEPINICAARRALILVLKGVASAEETSANAIHSTILIAKDSGTDLSTPRGANVKRERERNVTVNGS